MKKFLLFLALLLSPLPALAAAQPVAIVVATCPQTAIYGTVPGPSVPLTVDVNGNTCITGTLSFIPSGTQDVNLTKVGGAAIAIGQAAMAASLPVAIASNQSSIPVAATLAAETTKVIGTVNQGTSPWVVSGAVTGSGNFTVIQPTGTNLHAVLDTTSTTAVTQATASSLNATVVGTGTFVTQSAITAASGSFASGSLAVGSITNGADVAEGLTTDAKSTATDTTAVSQTSILKEISAMEQAPASRAVTNAGTFATQSAITAASGAFASGSIASGALASGSMVDLVALSAPTAPAAATAIKSALIGCQYNSTPETFTTGQQGLVECGTRGAIKVQIMTADGTATPPVATAADSTTLISALKVMNIPYTYNGTSEDLVRGAANALNSTGTGLPTAQVVSQFDDVSPTAITENQFGNLRMSANRNAYSTIRDAAGNERGVNVNASNQLSVSVDGTNAVTAASGAFASGSIASGAIASGAYASGSISDGAMVTLGAKADAKSTATDTTSITVMQVLKEISAMVQAPAALPANQSTNIAQVNGTAPTEKAASTSAALTDTSLVVIQSPNPSPVCTGIIAVNQTTSTDLKTFANFGYICAVMLVSATAQNLSLVEGTGTVCATGIAALIGGTTASLAVGANGGFSSVTDRSWLKTQTTADHLCILQSGAGNVSGVITYQDHS